MSSTPLAHVYGFFCALPPYKNTSKTQIKSLDDIEIKLHLKLRSETAFETLSRKHIHSGIFEAKCWPHYLMETFWDFFIFPEVSLVQGDHLDPI